jgi:chemotaxis protein methyltransferase CheR
VSGHVRSPAIRAPGSRAGSDPDSRDRLVTRALDEVSRHAGLFFKDVRLTGAVETIEDWIAEHGIEHAVDIGPGVALDALLEDLVVHESYFDRDIEQLRLVDELVLAELTRTTEAIRIWSAGCASGEEPYTVAFMLAARGLLQRATILATDLSRPALARARAGRYRAWAVRAGANSPAMRFLVQSGSEWCVPEAIKSQVAFEPLNLVEDPFPSDQRLITCRNVLIYLDQPAVAAVAQKFAAALAPDGWLFVAPSDPRLDPYAPLAATVTDRGVYYRRADQPKLPLPAPLVRRPRASLPPPPPVGFVPPLRVARAPSTAIPPAPKHDTRAARDRARVLADRGHYVEAREVLIAAIAAEPLDGELYFLEAVLFAADDVDAALRCLDRAIYLCPEAPVSYLFAARLRQSSGDSAGARRSYARALELLEALPPEARVLWSDEPAWIMADACRQALAAL